MLFENIWVKIRSMPTEVTENRFFLMHMNTKHSHRWVWQMHCNGQTSIEIYKQNINN
jgi:hypothetical protein